MKIGLDVLRRYVDLPDDARDARRLLDEQGIEVKRVEQDDVDTLFTLELLANRGDHYCYEGIARELDGRLGVGIRTPPVTTLEVGDAPVELRRETDLCSAYTATLLVKEGDGALPADAQRLLQAAGLNAVGPAVDATNVANLEWGQPTHAFDADTIVGPITIRTSQKGEQAWPLFTTEKVTLPEGTVVIADDEKVLAIAGVIGCEESRTTDGTTRLLLESATFDPVAVRIASRALQLFTDSSARFERGADVDRPLIGAGRVVALLSQAGWAVQGTTGHVGTPKPGPRQVAVSVSHAQTFLGIPDDAAQMTERLQRYGYEVAAAEDTLTVTVPTWRWPDVEHAADVLEDLAKSVGYDQTPIELPVVGLGSLPSPWEERRDRIEEVLLGDGFFEVFTDGFYGRKVVELLDLSEEHPLFAHVETQNALDRAYSLLKNNAVHQAIEAIAINERRRTLTGQMYEWTRTFHPTAAEGAADRDTPPCTERALLWAACFGKRGDVALDAAFLAGVVRTLATETGVPFVVGEPTADHPLASVFHPGRVASVRLDGEIVGILGEIHPAVCQRYKIKRVRPCYLEIDQAALASDGQRPPFVDPPVHQPIVRTVALAVPPPLHADDVRAALLADAPEALRYVDVVDVFVGVEEGTEVRSLTFELSYSNDDNQRSADEVNEMTEALVEQVLAHYASAGVVRR